MACSRAKAAETRADAAEILLRTMERGAIISQGTRRAITVEAKAGGSVTKPELDGPAGRTLSP